jgi:hypothetical protein
MADSINLTEANSEQLKLIQHHALRALALSQGVTDDRDDELVSVHLSIIIQVKGNGPFGGDI